MLIKLLLYFLSFFLFCREQINSIENIIRIKADRVNVWSWLEGSLVLQTSVPSSYTKHEKHELR